MATREQDGSKAARVLLVEDESLVAMLLEDMLEDLGHELAGSATTLDQALALAREGSFDLAILDVSLSGQETFPVADILEARDIPFVFATGFGQLPEGREHQPILHKPFDLPDLEASIEGLLKTKSA